MIDRWPEPTSSLDTWADLARLREQSKERLFVRSRAVERKQRWFDWFFVRRAFAEALRPGDCIELHERQIAVEVIHARVEDGVIYVGVWPLNCPLAWALL